MAYDRNLNNGTSPRVSLSASLLLPFPAASLASAARRDGRPRSPRGPPAPGNAASLSRPLEHLGQIPVECTLVHLTKQTLSGVPQCIATHCFSKKWGDQLQVLYSFSLVYY